jgi:hypothetical protein
MAEITYNIVVNPTTNVATAPITPADAKFNPGDKVSFTSNFAGTVIKYIHGSPFEEIKAGEDVPIPAGGAAGPFTMKDTKDSYHFECGSYEAAAWGATAPGGGASGKNVFVPWPGGGDTPKGGGGPGSK